MERERKKIIENGEKQNKKRRKEKKKKMEKKIEGNGEKIVNTE